LQAQALLTTEEAVGDGNNLLKLLNSRIDRFPVEESVARYLIEKMSVPDAHTRLTVACRR